MTTRGCVDQRVGHREPEIERQVRGLQGQTLIDWNDRGLSQRGDGCQCSLLRHVPPDDAVHLVDFYRGDNERIATL